MFSKELILNRKPGALDQALQRITHQLQAAPGPKACSAPATWSPTAARNCRSMSPPRTSRGSSTTCTTWRDESLIRQLEEQSEEILRGLPQLIEQMIERQKKLERRHALMRRSLRKIFDYSPAEQGDRGRHPPHSTPDPRRKTRRLKQDRTGHISVPHTLRRNIRYEGIPFDPVLRRHHEKRPRVVMLCDVSMSTRNMSRFWLHMVYQMQSLFSKVRTFVFVADVAEVTQFFEESSMDRAVDQVFSGRVLDADVNSDFGKANNSGTNTCTEPPHDAGDSRRRAQ